MKSVYKKLIIDDLENRICFFNDMYKLEVDRILFDDRYDAKYIQELDIKTKIIVAEIEIAIKEIKEKITVE